MSTVVTLRAALIGRGLTAKVNISAQAVMHSLVWPPPRVHPCGICLPRGEGAPVWDLSGIWPVSQVSRSGIPGEVPHIINNRQTSAGVWETVTNQPVFISAVAHNNPTANNNNIQYLCGIRYIGTGLRYMTCRC